MTPFFLVTGFLGSGKTTLLQEILEKYAATRRIAIIQNEFAPAGTDGKTLRRDGKPFKLVEVNNGSVFCVCLLSGFIQTLEKVMEEYAPEMVILEASGLSDPINILELLQDDALHRKLILGGIISVVDALNFERGLERMNRVRHQVMIADAILVNKMDTYTGDPEQLHEHLRMINPYAGIIPSRYCRVDLEGLFDRLPGEHPAATAFGKKVSEGRPGMRACVLRLHNRISPEGLADFLQQLQTDCPRIKGFVRTTDEKAYAVQTVFERLEIEEVTGYTGQTEVVAFGNKITPAAMRMTFLSFTKD